MKPDYSQSRVSEMSSTQ